MIFSIFFKFIFFIYNYFLVFFFNRNDKKGGLCRIDSKGNNLFMVERGGIWR